MPAQLVFGLIVISILFGDVLAAGVDRLERAVKRKATAKAWGDRKPGIEDDWEEFRYDPPAFTDGAWCTACVAGARELGGCVADDTE